MCLITYAPRGKETLDWDTLDYSMRTMNSDGFGVAWFSEETGSWRVMQSMRSHKLRNAVKKVPRETPLIIHQRYGTHGSTDMDNVHPFSIGNTGALLFHNGTINGTRAGRRGGINDTRAYIEDELAPLVEGVGLACLNSSRVQDSIGSRVGGSVLAIAMPGDSYPILINEYLGDWEANNLFYSNEYSRPVQRPHSLYSWARDDNEPRLLTHDKKGGSSYYFSPENEAFPDYDPPDDWRAYDRELDERYLEELHEDDRAFARRLLNGHY